MVWVFGYGSLMWDNWEAKHACRSRSIATLPGYRRAFTKLSQRNWGTKDAPCPTLNLEAQASGSCQGVAFAFSAESRSQLLAYLAEREGKNFDLRLLAVDLADEATVDALVPIYTGNNVLVDRTLGNQVRMIRSASGTDGAGIDYVLGLAAKLDELGIVDSVVTDLRVALLA